QTFKFDDLSDPDINIRYGTFYLRYLLDKFGGNEVAALAAYNAGETNVIAWGGADLRVDDIPFPETRGYVEDVLDKRDDYARHYRQEWGRGESAAGANQKADQASTPKREGRSRLSLRGGRVRGAGRGPGGAWGSSVDRRRPPRQSGSVALCGRDLPEGPHA